MAFRVGVLAVILAMEMAASAEQGYVHPPVAMNCKIYGRFVHCSVTNAADLVEHVWSYHKYQVTGKDDSQSGPIQITEKDCAPIIFYGSDPVDWRTHIAVINVRLKDRVATFEGCKQQNVREHVKYQ